MSIYELLKDRNFEEEFDRQEIQKTREYYSGFPEYTSAPTIEMYHLKKVLTNGDVQSIIDWYKNWERFNEFVGKKCCILEDFNTDNIEDPLRRGELKFRIKIIEELLNKGQLIL